MILQINNTSENSDLTSELTLTVANFVSILTNKSVTDQRRAICIPLKTLVSFENVLHAG